MRFCTERYIYDLSYHERHPRNIQKKLIIPQLQLLCLIFEQKRILNEKIINSRIEVIS
jgi:hypothetical protein